MACNRFSDLPAASATLTGTESIPLEHLGVDRQSIPPAIANSAVNYLSTATYRQGFTVLASDGNFYRAVTTTAGADPVARNPAIWVPVLFAANTTIAVPSEISTIAAAVAYLRFAAISGSVVVTIQVAAGAYALTTTQLNLTHPYGSQIQLIGAGSGTTSLTFTALASSPSSPNLNPDSGSIYVNSESGFGLINGFTISKAGGAAAFGHCAILAYSGSINLGLDLIISGFWFNLAAAYGGVVRSISNASGITLTATTASTACVYADAGIISVPGSDLNTSNASASLGSMRHGGTLFLTGGNFVGTNASSTLYMISEGGNLYESDSYGTYGTFLQGGGFFTFNSDSSGYLNGSIATRTDVTDFSLQVQGPIFGLGNSKLEALQVGTSGGGETPFSGNQAGTATLNGSGTVTVNVGWVTLNTKIVVSGAEAAVTGPLFSPNASIVANTSFVITSTAGATDAGKTVNWHATVYP